MKKIRLLAAVSAFALAFAFSAVLTPMPAAVSADENSSVQTTTPLEIANTVKTGITGSTSLVGDGDVFDYTLGVTEHTVTNNNVSTLFTTWKDFDTASGAVLKFGTWDKANYNLSGSPYGPYFNATTTDANCQVRVNWVQNITYKLTFNKAAVLTVTNEALSGIATTDNVIRIRVYKEADGQISRLSETPLYDGANTSQAANYFGGEYTMSAGEIFYFEYGCVGAYEKTLKKVTLGTGIFPTFTADTSKITNEVKTDLMSVIAASYGANGDVVQMGKATFTPAWGTLTDNQAFDVFTNNALQTTAKRDDGQYAAVYAGGSGKLIRTNGAKQKFLLKITAESAAKISFDNEAISQATNGSGYYTIYEGVVQSGATHYAKRFETSVGNGAVEKGALAFTMHVPAGNEVVLEIYGSAQGTNIYLFPTIAVDFASYDELEKYDFTQILVLASYKSEKQAALQSSYNGLDRADYLEDDLADIDAAYASALQDIKGAEDQAKVDLALAGYQGYLSEIVTISHLSLLKTQYKGELDTFLASLNVEDYTSEAYATIQAFISEGKNKIDNALTENAMDIAVKHAKAEIGLIPVKTGGTSCSSRMSVCAMAAALCLAATVVLRKKKGVNE